MILAFQLSLLCGGGAVLISFLSLGKLRLRQLARYYGAASFALALAIFFVGIASGNPHLYITAALTAGIKALAIPLLFFWITRTAHLNERLVSSVEPSVTYMLAALTIGFALFSSLAANPLFAEVSVEGLFEAFSFLYLGVLMVVLRRDLVSQIMGFLVFENGVSFLMVITVGDVTLLAELGILTSVLMSAYIMGILALSLKGLYAVENLQPETDYLE